MRGSSWDEERTKARLCGKEEVCMIQTSIHVHQLVQKGRGN